MVEVTVEARNDAGNPGLVKLQGKTWELNIWATTDELWKLAGIEKKDGRTPRDEIHADPGNRGHRCRSRRLSRRNGPRAGRRTVSPVRGAGDPVRAVLGPAFQ